MITSKNIKPYINFLHDKKYNTPANAELLDKWGALSDFQIIQELHGLYKYWNIDMETATLYERMFQYEQNPKPVTTPEPESDYAYYTKENTSSPVKVIMIIVISLLILGGGYWLYSRNDASKAELENKVQKANDVAVQEQNLRMLRDKEVQQKAYEKANKVKDITENIDRYITCKVNYTTGTFFGGIKKVSVKVSNNTDFKMNEIVVRLQYVKKNGELYSTEYVSVYNVQPHEQKTVSGAGSSRGVKVEYKISKYQSDEMENK